MSHFNITGAFTARNFLEDAIANEWQLEIKGSNQRRLLVIFYKGVWAVQDPKTKEYVQLNDSVEILENNWTVGLCETDDHFPPTSFWVGFCKQQLLFHNAADNGTVVTTAHLDMDIGRVIPAKIITDLAYLILHDIESIHVVKKERNGLIENENIVVV